MSKRMQVVVQDADLESYERTARTTGLSLSEWVRQTLVKAQREVASGDVDAKLSAVREAVRHNFPEQGIDTMLSEIEAGYQRSIDA